MISIPQELVEQIERNNVLPLVGEGINRSVLPSLTELARELAARCDYPADDPQTLSRVAAFYLLTNGDRHSLVSFLRDRLDKSGLEPTSSHRLLAKLHPRVVVTTCYDRLLERAVQEAALAYTPVVANEEVAYVDEEQMMLVWLWGVLDRPDSIIVTEDDHHRFLAGRKSLSYVLRAELCRRNWLFLGFDTQDEWFLHFYDGVVRDLDRHQRRSYIVGTNMSAYARAWWAKRAHIFDVEIEPFLAELINRVNLAGYRRSEERGEKEAYEIIYAPLPPRPYKHLDFYEITDAPIFFGRESEIQVLSSLIHAHRLVLFYGASGAGKTSLLLAGIVPRLEQAEAGYETFYLRIFEDPITTIRAAVCRRFADIDLPREGSLVDFLDAATRAMACSLVIIFDQFEEFFIRFNPQLRQAFIAELGRLYDAHDVPVKVVLALREDWLASINEIRERIPEVFNIDLRLLPLTRIQARQAITGPAERMGVRYDASLLNRLLDDLAEGTADSEKNFIMPPQLQLICNAVYDYVQAEGRHYITSDDYKSVGGAQGILERFVEKALDEHRGDARIIAKDVLMALVTSHETKGDSNSESLAIELGVEVATVEQVLARLAGQRLVRRLDEGNSYELAHDILATTVASWIGEEDRQLKQTRELLKREMADWKHDRSSLLSQNKFRRINMARDLLHFGDEESVFLLRSAILYDEDVSLWLEKVGESDVQSRTLLEMLMSDFEQARLNAARYLAEFPEDGVITTLAQTALTDSDLDVGRAAATSLGQMGTAVQTAIPFLSDALGTGESQQQSRAVQTLAVIADTVPELLRTASWSMSFSVYRELALIRLRREWPWIRLATAAGGGGGALGVGFGLGLPFALHASALSGGQWSVLDFVFIVPLLAVLGLLAGAITAFGISAGEALCCKWVNIGRVIGGAIFGGLGFDATFCPLVIADTEAVTNVLLGISGAGLLGLFMALGMMFLRATRWPRVGTLVGGAVGGSIGFVLWGVLGYKPLQVQSVPLGILLASGAFCGLIIAAAIDMAEMRRR